MSRPGVDRGIDAGFTLLELMVVIVIAAVLTGLVVLRLGDWQPDSAPERQLERFRALLDAQCEQAMFQSRARGVRMTEEGYDFWQATSDGWVLLPDDGTTRARQWLGEPGVELRLSGHRVRLSDEAEAPHVVCQPLGEMSPFTLSLDVDAERFRLSADGLGRMNLEQRR